MRSVIEQGTKLGIEVFTATISFKGNIYTATHLSRGMASQWLVNQAYKLSKT